MPNFPSLDRDLVVDVAVVGGGITGITTAYLLKRAGLRVALLERDLCGRVDTSYTTAHLTCVTDLRLHKLTSRFGEAHARATWDAGLAAINQISNNIKAEGIDCGFAWVPGYLHLPMDDKQGDVSSLQEDAELARKLVVPAEFLEAVPYFGRSGVRFSHQAKFHPLKYLSALSRTIPGSGSHVFEKTEATEFIEKPLVVKSHEFSIHCRYVVLATHVPIVGKGSLLSATLLMTKLHPYTSYALGAKLPHGLLPEALFWDTGSPYHYLRVDRRTQSDYAIFGGEDHKTGQERHTETAYGRLQKKLTQWIPEAALERRWSGLVIETNDGLPFIGETAEGQFVATGFSGNGMTFGTLSAMMAVDACFQRGNPWSELFSPHRKNLRRGAWNYLGENTNYPYSLVRDRVARSEGTHLRGIRRGHGKILNLQGEKVAAYRDEDGQVTLKSPVCTHLGCIVVWNDAEQTWDCPCHGSRFKATGEVVSGTVESTLQRVEHPSAKHRQMSFVT